MVTVAMIVSSLIVSAMSVAMITMVIVSPMPAVVVTVTSVSAMIMAAMTVSVSVSMTMVVVPRRGCGRSQGQSGSYDEGSEQKFIKGVIRWFSSAACL